MPIRILIRREVIKVIEIKNQADRTDIYVTGDILDDCWKGWSWGEDISTYPIDIRRMLDGAKGKPVNVYINSGGGDLFAGVAISNMLKRHDSTTKAIIDGLAGSAASIIAFGCEEIEMPSNSYLMIHKPSCSAHGNADDLLKMAETLEVCQEGIVNTYFEKAKDGVTKEAINDYVNKETWFTGASATDVFNITLTDNKSNYEGVGNCIMNYAHTPRIFKNDDKKRKAIDIALNLY